MTSEPKKTGRPSLYTEALAAKICKRLTEGEPLRSICRDKAMPDEATVPRWLADKKKIDKPSGARFMFRRHTMAWAILAMILITAYTFPASARCFKFQRDFMA